MLNRIFIAGFLFVLVAVFPQMASSQEALKQDDDPIQAGYVIITPVTEAGVPLEADTGLFVFETFGEKKNNLLTTAGVLPSNMTTSTVMFVNTSGRLSRNVGVAIANPAGSAAPSTDITLTLRGTDGAEVATTTFALESGRHTAVYVSQMFENQKDVPKDFVGTLLITSSENPVAAMGLRFRGDNFSTMPLTSLSGPAPVPLNGEVGGAGAVILPQFAVGGGWESEIVLTNTGTATLFVRVDLYKSDGSALTTTLNGETGSSFAGISIPPGGVYILARRDNSGDSEF